MWLVGKKWKNIKSHFACFELFIRKGIREFCDRPSPQAIQWLTIKHGCSHSGDEHLCQSPLQIEILKWSEWFFHKNTCWQAQFAFYRRWSSKWVGRPSVEITSCLGSDSNIPEILGVEQSYRTGLKGWPCSGTAALLSQFNTDVIRRYTVHCCLTVT